MQTDTADASNSNKKLQHWISIKKQIVKYKDIFQENPSKTKSEDKFITGTI